MSKYVFFRIDDIQDNSILRRGIPVAHSIYGIASTINAANYTSFIAMERVMELDHPKVCAEFILYRTFFMWNLYSQNGCSQLIL